MSLLTSLSPYLEEIKLGAIVVAAGALFTAGFYLGGLGPKSSLSALRAADWEAKYQASQVALTSAQGQLKRAQDVSANNATVIQGLNDANAKIAADRDSNLALAHRLLNSAPTLGPFLPQADNKPRASSAPSNPGTGQTEGLLADAADESEQCAVAYNALLSQLKPQL